MGRGPTDRATDKVRRERGGSRLASTPELNGANAFEYLVALQRHHDDVAEHPAEWMPWNYQQALARLRAAGRAPPA
ncbi:MAG: hypothetical protein HY744_27090 [Deltaproteobacteria bacterium]|nr:hypothetical protein [Deltaproteobacteria bacterium]